MNPLLLIKKKKNPNIEGSILKGKDIDKGKYLAEWIITGPKGTITHTSQRL